MTTRPTAGRPRIIERWFPCAEVSAASGNGWGSSNSEILVMSWFAKRPLAQSRAAVLCSLLPWPEDEDEQERVKAIIRESLNSCQDPDRDPNSPTPHKYGIVDCCRHKNANDGYDAARADVLALLAEHYPSGTNMLDPFSGRGLIPLEAARFKIQAHAIDYSPVATLASRLLIDWPFRDWDDEPPLPFDGYDATPWQLGKVSRLAHDIKAIQEHVGDRFAELTDPYYPDNAYGEKPWGYLWASVIPCNECGREFPLYGSNELRKANKKKDDPGQSFELVVDSSGWTTRVVSGTTSQSPTMQSRPGINGKLAWCPYPHCGHAHGVSERLALVEKHYKRVEILAVADIEDGMKVFRPPTADEVTAAEAASTALAEKSVNGFLASPDERIGRCNRHHVPAVMSGAVTWGDLSVDRQNLAHAFLAQAISDVGDALLDADCSSGYAQALTGYCGGVFARKLKRSTRGARLQTAGGAQVGDVFINESSIAFNYEFFEAGIGDGPGTWNSVGGLPTAVARLADADGMPGSVQRGSALSLPFKDDELDAIVTDPPYDDMIDYADCSDLWFVWLKRSLAKHHWDFAMTADPDGGQEKAQEIIVKDRYYEDDAEHRTPDWYDRKIEEAFVEHARAVHDDGVVTIVFGHSEPDVWNRLLGAIAGAGLVLTGAWPANTEKGGQAGSANINTTLTLCCRPAPPGREPGDYQEVVAEIRGLVEKRVHTVWTPSQLSYVDQKMAAVGPALEVVGRYSEVKNHLGRPVPLADFLPIARAAVTDAWDFRFSDVPLEVFDRRTQFVLEWVESYGRSTAAASEARWQRLSSGMEESETDGLLTEVKKPNGVRLAFADEMTRPISPESSLIDIAFAMVRAWQTSTLDDAAAVVAATGLDPSDDRLWALVSHLSVTLAADRDGTAWSEMIRGRSGLTGKIASTVRAQRHATDETTPTVIPGVLFTEETA